MRDNELIEAVDRRSAVIAVAAAAGVLVLLALWVVWDAGSSSPRTAEGWAMPNAAGTAISLHDASDGGAGEGHVIAGAEWRDRDGVWHDGTDLPTCLGPDTSSLTHVRLGLVTVETPDGRARERVAWLECLE